MILSDTLLELQNGERILAKEVRKDQFIKAYELGEVRYIKVNNVSSLVTKYSGLQIFTQSGNMICTTAHHKIWADGIILDNEYIVYMMYRPEFGFRVGKTNMWKNNSNEKKYSNQFGQRTSSEAATHLWVLDIAKDNEEAIWLEEVYSLQYGVPTTVFSGANRGLNQERIDKIFAKFGNNGYKLLEAKDLLFDHPHWNAYSSSTSKIKRHIIRMISHHSKGNTVSFEYKDEEISAILHNNGYRPRKGHAINSNEFLRFYRHSYTEALEYAITLSKLTKSSIVQKISFNNHPLYLLTASALYPKMCVISADAENRAFLDPVVAITPINEELPYIDITIDRTLNLFGNGILVHN